MSTGSGLTRRELLRQAASASACLAVGGLAAACAPPATSSATPTRGPTSLPPPETTTVRIHGIPTCDAPIWLVEEFLREEGFKDVTFVSGPTPFLLTGGAEFGSVYANTFVGSIDADFPTLAVAGIHTGCIELWAGPGISSIRDLRGKTYQVVDRAVTFEGRSHPGVFYGFLLSILAHIGMDPAEMKLVDVKEDHPLVADYLDGKSDTIFLPVHQAPLMRRNPRRRGSVILDSTMDKPWSQNYCCMLVARRDWAKSNPVAAKRATRAFLRASDAVAADRKAAVRKIVEKGFYKANAALTPEILEETISMLSYDWRDFDPEDTLRFFALRLRDAKQLRKTPQQIIDEGSDLAYFRQLRKELKA